MTELDNHEIGLRPQTDKDEDFLLSLYISTRETELIQVGWTPAEMRPFLQQQFTAQHQSYLQHYPDADFQIIEYRGQAAGRLYLHRGVDEYRIIDIALLPEFRNRKLGEHLIQDILDSARANSLPVSLHVEQQSPAIRLYQRLGFEKREARGLHLLMQWAPARGIEVER